MTKHFILCFVLQALLFVGCTSPDQLISSELTVNKKSLDFYNKSSAQEVSVSADGGDWSARADQSWCHLSQSDQIVTIAVDDSPESSVREATVTVRSGTQTRQVRVRQLGSDPAILIDEQEFHVDAVGGDVNFNVTTNVDVNITLPSWIQNKVASTRASEMVTTNHSYTVQKNTEDSKRDGKIVVKMVPDPAATHEGTLLSDTVRVRQSGLGDYDANNAGTSDGATKIKVVSGTATSTEPGFDIEKSFDGDLSTYYISNSNNSSETYFPITLTYNFAQAADVDYLVYSSRPKDPTGHFSLVQIQYSEDGTHFEDLAEHSFRDVLPSSKYIFDRRVHAKSFRFIVKGGLGEGRGRAACAEMEFYNQNLEKFDYSTLFNDSACTQLKAGITEAEIEQCNYPFFKNIAYYMLHGKYPREFRIASYKAYPSPTIQSGLYKTTPYSLLDNPTGISVDDNESFVVLVGETHGKKISINVQNLDVPGGDGFGGTSYPLKQGFNKITVSQKGLVYLMYHTDVLSDPTALPITVHFASGKVNGYYDSQKHHGRWTELLGKATNKYFDVLGQYAHLTFETADFLRYTGPTGDELIGIYDKIVYHEQLLLGLYKQNRFFKNRMYFNVMYHGYMYTLPYHTGYNQTTMNKLCDPQTLKTTDLWGPAHEVGHMNQTLPGVRWVGTTEVTNNIMSEYIQTSVFNQPSRVQTEDLGSLYSNRYSKAWNGIIVNNSPHSDFRNLGNDENDVFCKLIPFWQLELYFGKVLGRTPLNQEDKGGFYPSVYEYARNKDYEGMSNGEIQLDFVYNCCLNAHANLLDFFRKWGFLTPIDKVINDYESARMTITQAMINALEAKVNQLGFPALTVPLEYITDNTVELFARRTPIVRGGTASITPSVFSDKGVNYKGHVISIPAWQNVVAYEVYDDRTHRNVFISTSRTTHNPTEVFNLPMPWVSYYRLYAVSVTGQRSLVSISVTP